MSRFIIRRAKAEDGAALCAIYAPYITDTTITFEYEVPTDAAFSDRIRETAAQFPYLVCDGYHTQSADRQRRRDHRLHLRAPHP